MSRKLSATQNSEVSKLAGYVQVTPETASLLKINCTLQLFCVLRIVVVEDDGDC